MIEDMMTYVTFHVIDASTNLLLGRPVLLYVRLYESSIFRDKNEGFPLPALLHDSKVIHLMTEMGYDP